MANLGFGDPFFFAMQFGKFCDSLKNVYDATLRFSAANINPIFSFLADVVANFEPTIAGLMSNFAVKQRNSIATLINMQPRAMRALRTLFERESAQS